MGPPVRVVCIDCLQSIEVSASGSSNQAEACPHCGASLDPSQAGIQSRPGLDDSPATIDLSEVSTFHAENPLVGSSRLIGRFQIRFALGEGGYGQVFRAYDPHLEREVALKVLKPNRLGEKALQRFYREARAAARLDHPNIVGLHDAGRDDGRCWIAYQLVAGRTLSAVRDLERPSVIESVRIVRDLALGLHHAHSRGVYHRDLKPANIMIDESGRPRLTDFGLARRDDVDSDLTTEGTVLGTPQYMSPEAAAGRAHEADARSDVYSLGVILYELICGRRPCDVPTGAPLWRAIHHVTPPTPRSVDRAVPPMLDRICMKALALDPNERYRNAELLADALTDQMTKFRPARKPSEQDAESSRPRFRRWGKLAAAAGFGLTALAALALSIPRPAWPDRPAPALVVDHPVPGVAVDSVREVLAVQESGATPVQPVEATHRAETAPRTPPRTSEPTKANSSPSELEKLPFITSKGSPYYHRAPHLTSKRCSHQIKKPITIGTIGEAREMGLRPCPQCLPDSLADE